jgi:hypothetical protein
MTNETILAVEIKYKKNHHFIERTRGLSMITGR